jgi:DNA polymerase-3 subunit epsilon
MSMASAWQRWFGRDALADDTRWVVLDVEASGLDPARDRLLAIAAIGVHFDSDGARGRIALGDSFEVVLRQGGDAGPADKANILLHGIGVGAQRGGVEPAVALDGFVAFAGRSPLLAFHAAFDRTLIERACRAAGRPRPPNPWLDLEPLAAVLHPQVRARSLDEWMAHFDIRCAVRHQAAADTLATAELLLRLWPQARREMAAPGFAAAARLAAQRRWLAGAERG